jgi:hypothetical protein
MGESRVFERSMAPIVDRLTRTGYVDVFVGEAAGVRGTKSGFLHRPEELRIEAIERFEGISNPEDETIVLALHCTTHGCRGTYVAPYGKDMPSIDATLIRKMPDARGHPAHGGQEP